jgi:hypothetical protein
MVNLAPIGVGYLGHDSRESPDTGNATAARAIVDGGTYWKGKSRLTIPGTAWRMFVVTEDNAGMVWEPCNLIL